MTDRRNDTESPREDGSESRKIKKTFIEPDIREFDDLEKQIRSPLIGTFTP
jgi:hypothetical protein